MPENRLFSKVFNTDRSAPSFGYIYDASAISTGSNPVSTGNWRPLVAADMSANISLTGASFTVGNVCITGGQLSLIGTSSVSVTNPVLAISGAVNSTILGGSVGITGLPTIYTIYSGSSTVSNSTPSGANGLALSANNSRSVWFVQNQSTGNAPLFVGLGTPAGTGAYNMVLKSASNTFAGDGGSFLDDGARWKGAVYVSGQNTNYIIWELK